MWIQFDTSQPRFIFAKETFSKLEECRKVGFKIIKKTNNDWYKKMKFLGSPKIV